VFGDYCHSLLEHAERDLRGVLIRISAGTTSSTADIPLALRIRSSIAAAYGVSDFKQSIRRDTNAYPVLNENKHFNNWNCSVISQARAHDISDVFDTSVR